MEQLSKEREALQQKEAELARQITELETKVLDEKTSASSKPANAASANGKGTKDGAKPGVALSNEQGKLDQTS